MARRRASMREGPLAELFRATEAAQKQAEQSGEGEQKAPEDAPTAPAVTPPPPPDPNPLPPPPPPEIRASDLRPVSHYLEPLPESPARLHRGAADAGSY